MELDLGQIDLDLALSATWPQDIYDWLSDSLFY